jgi:hypothetical protein
MSQNIIFDGPVNWLIQVFEWCAGIRKLAQALKLKLKSRSPVTPPLTVRNIPSISAIIVFQIDSAFHLKVRPAIHASVSRSDEPTILYRRADLLTRGRSTIVTTLGPDCISRQTADFQFYQVTPVAVLWYLLAHTRRFPTPSPLNVYPLASLRGVPFEIIIRLRTYLTAKEVGSRCRVLESPHSQLSPVFRQEILPCSKHGTYGIILSIELRHSS